MPPRTKKAAPKAAAGKTKAAASKGRKRVRDSDEQSIDKGEVSVVNAPKLKKSRISGDSIENVGQSTPTESEADDTPAPVPEDSSDTLKKEFSGNFDLYSMRLPFLSEVFLPKGKTQPQYEALYEKILSYQAKDDNSLQLYLQNPSSIEERGQIRSTVDAMCDPMEEMPFDVEISDVTVSSKLALKVNERKLFLAPPSEGPGIEGRLSIVDGGCGIASSKGVVKLKHLWKSQKKGADGTYAELFEGYVSFRVSYSGLYSRKGHGNGENLETAVWAVRARKDENGEEIGIGPLKLTTGWH